MKVLVGYFIRRTWKLERVDGKTWCAWPHTLYPTREKAEEALVIGERGGHLDTAYEHDVCEAWMHTDGDQ